jgi:hypothetical protein
MSTMHETHGAGPVSGAAPDAPSQDTSLPEPAATFVIAFVLITLGILFVLVLGFVGFSDLMPRLAPSPPTTFR